MEGNRHYIRADETGRILEGWSDGIFPDRDAAGAVCIDDGGGYQFRLFFGGPENPALFEEHGVALYKWDGARVFPRAEEEIRAEIEALPPPGPSAAEQENTLLRAQIQALTERADFYEDCVAEMAMHIY